MIRSILDYFGDRHGRRKELAARLNTSPSTVTRLLNRDDHAITIGEFRDAAEAAGLRPHLSVYSQTHTHQALQRTTFPSPTDPGARPGSGHPLLRHAAQADLLRHMTAHHAPETRTLHSRRTGAFTVTGWPLGTAPALQIAPGYTQPECDVWLVIYTTHPDWTATDVNNILLHHDAPDVPCTLLYHVNHSAARQELLRPTAAGRTYLTVPGTLHSQRLDRTALVRAEGHPGQTRHTLLLDLDDTFDPYHDLGGHLDHLLKGTDIPSGIPVQQRVHRIFAAHGVPSHLHLTELQALGFAVTPASTPTEVDDALTYAPASALRRLADEYRTEPEWVLSGRGTPADQGAHTFALDRFFHRAAALTRHTGALPILCLAVAPEGHAVQFAWRTPHPRLPDVSVYDVLAPIRWDQAGPRLRAKAVFVYADKLGVTVQATLGADLSPSGPTPLFAERWAAGVPTEADAFARQHGGLSEQGHVRGPEDTPTGYFTRDGGPASVREVLDALTAAPRSQDR